MKKYEALIILSQLNPLEKVRLIIDMPNLGVNSLDTVGAHVFFLEKTYISENANVIKLESSSFDFALAYNKVCEPQDEPMQESYSEEQEDAMYGESHFIQMLEATKDLF